MGARQWRVRRGPRGAWRSLSLALCGIDVAANGKHCKWMLDADGDQFERLMLADGYGVCAAGGTRSPLSMPLCYVRSGVPAKRSDWG